MLRRLHRRIKAGFGDSFDLSCAGDFTDEAEKERTTEDGQLKTASSRTYLRRHALPGDEALHWLAVDRLRRRQELAFRPESLNIDELPGPGKPILCVPARCSRRDTCFAVFGEAASSHSDAATTTSEPSSTIRSLRMFPS